jgi:hypothetical protein
MAIGLARAGHFVTFKVGRFRMQGLTRRHLLGAAALIGPALFAKTLVAEEPKNATAPGRAASPQETGSDDAKLAMELLITGRKQIVTCEMALKTLTDQAAKQFAQIEIQEHEDLAKQLNTLGFEYKAQGNKVNGKDDAKTVARPYFAVAGKELPAKLTKDLTICHEVAEQCIATQQAEMGKLKGEVNRRFIEQQLDTHYSIFDHAVVFARHASPELAKIIEGARPTIEKHIYMCKDIRQKTA